MPTMIRKVFLPAIEIAEPPPLGMKPHAMKLHQEAMHEKIYRASIAERNLKRLSSPDLKIGQEQLQQGAANCFRKRTVRNIVE